MTTVDIKNRIDAPLDAYELHQNASHVVMRNPLGLFTTVNAAGVPRSRWMVGVISPRLGIFWPQDVPLFHSVAV